MRKRRADTAAVGPAAEPLRVRSWLVQALVGLWIAAITLLHYGNAVNAILEHLPKR